MNKQKGFFSQLSQPMDLTLGTPWKVILKYSAPIIISYLLQQIYVLTDAIICGQVLSSPEVAGVNDTFPLTFIFLQFAFGCTAGFSVITAKFVGQNDPAGVRKSFAAQIYLSVGISALLTVISIVLLPWLLGIINVTEANKEVYDAAYSYCFVIFIGIIAQMGYNFICGILRAYGDSVTPLIFLVISTALNVVLDIVLLSVFKMGPSGAAIATVLAQFISVIACSAYTFIRYKELRLRVKDFKVDFASLMMHIKQGIPLGLQFSVLAVGVIVMHGAVVEFDLTPNGTMTVGTPAQNGYGAGSKLINFLMAAFNGLGSAILGFNAQNYGKRDYDRIKRGTVQTLIIMVIVSLICLAGGLLLSINGAYQYIFMSADKVSSETIRTAAHRKNTGAFLNVLPRKRMSRSIPGSISDTAFPRFPSSAGKMPQSVPTPCSAGADLSAAKCVSLFLQTVQQAEDAFAVHDRADRKPFVAVTVERRIAGFGIKFVRIHDTLFLRIKNRNVRGTPVFQCADRHPENIRGTFGEFGYQGGKIKILFVIKFRKADLNRRFKSDDTERGIVEFNRLRRIGMRRMVCGYDRDRAVAQALDYRQTILLGTQGRIHFVIGIELFDFDIREGDMVRSRFRRNLNAFFLRSADDRQRTFCGDMLDMHFPACGSGKNRVTGDDELLRRCRHAFHSQKHRPVTFMHDAAAGKNRIFAVIENRQFESARIFDHMAHKLMILNTFPVIGKRHDSGGFQSADARHLLSLQTFGDRAAGKHLDDAFRLSISPDVMDGSGVVRTRTCVRHGYNGGESACRRRQRSGVNGFRIRLAGLPQVDMQVNETGSENISRQVNDFRIFQRCGIGEHAILHTDVHDFVDIPRGIDHARTFVNSLTHFRHPATRNNTAMRTASPLVTCSRMTDCGPSASADASSTSRLIGPGCMIKASGLIYLRLSLSSPKTFAYSPVLGKNPLRWRSC